jgi:uncharacterized delta-60 repeat protein
MTHTLLLFLSLICLTAAGPFLDTSFGRGSGYVVFDAQGQRDAAYALALAGRRAYVTGPVAMPTTGTDFGLVALDIETGELDTSFGNGGWRVIDFGNNKTLASRTDVPTAIAIDPSDGSLVLMGTANFGTTGSGNENLTFALARVLSSGHVDRLFGTDPATGSFVGDGTAELDVNPLGINDEVFDGLVVDDGKIVAVGFSNPGTVSGAGPQFDIGVARFRSDGTRDGSFGGLLGTPPATTLVDVGIGWDDRPRSIIETTYGYLIGSRTRPPWHPSGKFMGSLVALNKDGSIYRRFGQHQLNSFNDSLTIGRGAAVYHPDGKNGSTVVLEVLQPKNSDSIFVAGQTTAWDDGASGTNAMFVLRVSPSGLIQKSFGDDGWAIIRFPNSTTNELQTIQYDHHRGRIYVGGRVTMGATSFCGFAALDHRGQLVRSFGNSGTYTVDAPSFIDAIASSFVRDMKILSNDRLLFVGEAVRKGAATADFLVGKLRVQGGGL